MKRTLTQREAQMLESLVTVDGFQSAVRDIVATMNDRCTLSDYHLRVVYGARTAEEQDRLYAQGRTTPGPIVTRARAGESAHCYAAAADLALCIDRSGAWLPGDHPAWGILAAIVRARGAITGSDFKSFADRAHVELRGWTARARMGSLSLWHGAPATGARGGTP
jgi:peptidoglycan LD-endopeptidase CwlK